MAAAAPAPEMGIFRQLAFASFLTSLDAYMVVVTSNPEGKIAMRDRSFLHAALSFSCGGLFKLRA
jgi:hypothetical protein